MEVIIKVNISDLNEAIANASGYESVQELIDDGMALKNEDDVSDFIDNCINNTLYPQNANPLATLQSMGYVISKV